MKALKIFDIMTLEATDSEMNNFAVVTKDNYKARSELAWAATQALNFTTFCGIENNPYDTHFLEHTLSAEYNIAHGAGLSILMPARVKFQKAILRCWSISYLL